MEARISLVTLGVTDIKKSRNFYENGLGWKVSSISNEHVVFFHTQGAIIGLYSRDSLAEDAQVDAKGNGFRGITLAHNVRTKSEVASVLNTARKAGAKILKEAQDVFWGGHSGYFADHDGHLWEVAWNPHFELLANGEVKLPL